MFFTMDVILRSLSKFEKIYGIPSLIGITMSK